jgi:hypothetical protein
VALVTAMEKATVVVTTKQPAKAMETAMMTPK